MQSIPKRSRTCITLSLLGSKPLECEIDKRKLTFFGQLCRHSVNHFSRDIFYYRLMHYVNNSGVQRGFFHDISRILHKYSLDGALEDFISTGLFPSKETWKRIVKYKINYFYLNNNKIQMESDSLLKDFRVVKDDDLSLSRIWQLSKIFPPFHNKCQRTVVLLNRLFYDTFTKQCTKCNNNIDCNIIQHAILECKSNEAAQTYLWQFLFKAIGCELFYQFMALTPRQQLLSLFSGLVNIIDTDQRQKACLRVVVNALYRM